MSETSRSDTQIPAQVVLVRPRRRWFTILLGVLLVGSVLLNVLLLAASADYFGSVDPPYEQFHSGDATATAKIARLVVDTTIMPPFTQRVIDAIEKARDDDDVVGAVLVINSPGGLVSDSHEIYHHLRQLSASKPLVVVMKGLAASGGYYIAMGGGPEAPIYAEPTTWTGSIGVILPRYDLSALADKIGIHSDSLATGPLKDTLNPIKPLSEQEKEVWQTILDDSFQRFLSVIDEGREDLDMDKIRELATGQVYTAEQALKNGLVDVIGYEDEATAALAEQLGLSTVRVIDYESPKTLTETLLGIELAAPPASSAADPVRQLAQATSPRPMYLFGWPTPLLSPQF